MITCKINPTKLSWDNFQQTGQVLRDPHDNGIILAVTSFKYDIVASRGPRRVKKKFMLPEDMTIKITPKGKVSRTVLKDWSLEDQERLLAHEIFHYQVGFVCGRALAQELRQLAEPSRKVLDQKLNEAQKKHMLTRAGAIQIAYDHETQHGKNVVKQKQWQNKMKTCLANQNATKIGSLVL